MQIHKIVLAVHSSGEFRVVRARTPHLMLTEFRCRVCEMKPEGVLAVRRAVNFVQLVLKTQHLMLTEFRCRVCEMKPEGSVIVIFPYQLHAYGKGDGVINYLSSLISVDFLEQNSNTLLSTLPENPIVTVDRLPIGFREQFIQAYNTHIFPGPNHREICSSLLGAVMGELLGAMKLLEIDKKIKTGLPINQLRGFWNIVFKTLRRTYLLTLFQRRCF